MKKFIYFSAAAIATLFATSCSSEDVPQVTADDGFVTFEVKLPAEVTTRAYFGEGNLAKNLYVAVYDANGKLLSNLTNFDDHALPEGMIVNNFGEGTLTTTVTIPLVKNENYKIVFWADSYTSNSPFMYYPEGGFMTVDYTKFVGNSDAPDAFYACVPVTANGTTHPTVELKRPFAQINIGTDDYSAAEKAGLKVEKAGMKITGVSNVVTLLDGTIDKSSDFDGTVTFTATPEPTDKQFPVAKPQGDPNPYQYLAMGYVLCGNSQTAKGNLDHVELWLNDDAQSFATYDNVPAQSNFRTNIYGSLLTNKENFTVTITPGFVDTYDNAISVDTKEDLISAVKDGKNVVLNDNIELDNSFAQSIPAGKPVQVDLAGNDLTITATNILTNKTVSFVNQSNEKSTINLNANGNVIVAGTGSTVHVKNVNLTVADNRDMSKGASTAIKAAGHNANVIIEDCTITYYTYGLGTNAAEGWKGMTVTMNNVTVRPVEGSNYAAFGALFNSDMEVNANNCYFEGINGGVLMRGGKYNMTGCTFVQALFGESTTQEQLTNDFRRFFNRVWGSGSAVPCAPLTVGNRGTAYQYPTIVTLTDCTLRVHELAKNILPAMYVYANPTPDLGVNITINDCHYNDILEFASTNIIFNGNAITEAVNYPANM